MKSAAKMAPAMAAGISDRLWEKDDMVRLVEAYETSAHRAASMMTTVLALILIGVQVA